MSFGLSTITQGLSPLGSPVGLSTLAYGGLPTSVGPPINEPRGTEISQVIPSDTPIGLGLNAKDLFAISDVVRDVQGSVIAPAAGGLIDFGSGVSMGFDSVTSRGVLIPAIKNIENQIRDWAGGIAPIGFSGSDVRIIIEIPAPKIGNTPPRFFKQLIECTTLTISIHRSQQQVRAGGYINPKGLARGSRTIGGTLILTQFTRDVLADFLHSALMVNDLSKDSHYYKVDQLPPIDMTLVFCNEYGFASHRRLTGVSFVTDGTIISQNDMYVEQTISYLATDLTPLTPLSVSSFFNRLGTMNSTVGKIERTVQEIWRIGEQWLPATS